jgi:colicin import membrane protein
MNADAILNRPEEPGKLASGLLAAAVHILLAMLLFYGVRWQTTAPEAVEVELVQAMAPAEEPEAAPEPEPRPEPKVEPRPEPKPVAKPDIALKEKEKPKPPPQEKPRTKVDELKDRFKNLLNRDAAQLSNRKAAASAGQDLARHEARQAAAAREKGIADYLSKIRGKIRGNIVLPPNIQGNPEAIFLVTQLPSGEVLSVKQTSSSGIPALDAAIERAIRKSSPLPKPDNSELFSRELELKFRPMEE